MMFKKEVTFRGKKLTPKDLLLLVIALAAIAFYLVFYFLGMSAADNKTRLETEVAQTKATYSTIQNIDTDALGQEKTEIESQVNAVFPVDDEGEDLIITLSDWAEDSGLLILDKTVSTTKSDTLGEVDCLATTVTIKVKGEDDELTDLLGEIKTSITNEDISTLVIDNTGASLAGTNWTATIKVTVYTGASYTTEETTE